MCGLTLSSESTARAKGKFSYCIPRQTTSFWVALAFMVVKGIPQNMPPLFTTSSEIGVNVSWSALDSLGEQFNHSLSISPHSPQRVPMSTADAAVSSSSLSHTSTLTSLSQMFTPTSSSHTSASTLSSQTSISTSPSHNSISTPLSCTSVSTSLSHASSTLLIPSTAQLSPLFTPATPEMSRTQATASLIIYRHKCTLHGIVSTHYHPASTSHIQDLAFPHLGNLAAHYLTSHGYGTEDIGFIIEVYGRVPTDEFILSLARRGMAVHEARFLSVLINIHSTT